MDVVLKRMAVKSKEVPPVGNFLSLHIEASGQPCCLQRVVRVSLQPLTLR